jgi:enoyl-CoA hydratase/carnithine racemase
MSNIITVERKGAVAIVTMDRGEKRNALSQEMVLELTRVAQAFQDDTSTSAVVLTGSASEFSAGIDLSDPEATVPIGAGCRICDRPACPQRAFPYVGRPVQVDPQTSSNLPYSPTV